MYWFIGIKGTGMAALAQILSDRGEEVAGSDLERHFFTEEPLLRRGIRIVPFSPDNIPDHSTVIIGNAFSDDFPEVKAALENPTCRCYRYHVFLGKLMEGCVSIGVAGSHGKTTTTGMCRALLERKGKTGYLIGDGEGSLPRDAEYFVVEADEFRRHFLAYKPDYAVVTNIEIDHVDYFRGEDDYRSAYEEFLQGVKRQAFVNGDDGQARKMRENSRIVWFGLGEGNDVRAVHLAESSRDISYDVLCRGEKKAHFRFPFVGRHMVYDSLAAVCLGLRMGLKPQEIEDALFAFPGVKRRFVIQQWKGSVFVDDYAHHPTEVRATLEAARKRWPDRKIVAVFKPHRMSRLQYFADQFADALSLADEVGLCEFTSIDDKEPGLDVHVSSLAEKIPGSMVFHETEEEAKKLSEFAPCVYVFMSSKDIYPFMEKVKKCL